MHKSKKIYSFIYEVQSHAIGLKAGFSSRKNTNKKKQLKGFGVTAPRIHKEAVSCTILPFIRTEAHT